METKNGGLRRAAMLVLLFLATFPVSSQATSLKLLFSSTNNVHAESTAYLTLHALNPTTNHIYWLPPASLEARLRSESHRFSLWVRQTDSAPSERLSVPPNSFVVCPYMFNVPIEAAGEMVLEFVDPIAPQLVVHVDPPKPAEPVPQKPESRVMRWLRDAEREGSPRAFNPKRFFQEHISGYEPFYFIAGPESPNARFQISFKYKLLNQEGWLAQKPYGLDRFYVAYTQTSLWDLDAPSAPFFDSSYKPELIYYWENVGHRDHENPFHLNLQAGVQHESNGRDGLDSRSLNIAYIRPTFIFGPQDSLQLTLQPRAWVYLPDLEDNPDLADYRGYVDLRTIIGWNRGLQLSATGRIGDTWENGSLQLDLTYPLMKIFYSNFSIYLHAQYFTGYGESLLRYDERSSAFRIGFSMYR